MGGTLRMTEEEAIRRGIIPPPPPRPAFVMPDFLEPQPKYESFSPGFRKAIIYIAWWFFGIFCGMLFK